MSELWINNKMIGNHLWNPGLYKSDPNCMKNLHDNVAQPSPCIWMLKGRSLTLAPSFFPCLRVASALLRFTPHGIVTICCVTASPSLFFLEGSSTACVIVTWIGFFFMKTIEHTWGYSPSPLSCSNPRLHLLPPSWVLKYSLRQCWMCDAQLILSSLSAEGFVGASQLVGGHAYSKILVRGLSVLNFIH